MSAPVPDERVETVARALAPAWVAIGLSEATPMDDLRHLAAAAIAALPPSPAEEAVKRVEALLPRIEAVIEFDMAGERYDAVTSIQQVLEHLRTALASPEPAPQGGLDEIVIDDQCPITGRRCDRPCGAECIRGMFAAPQDDLR